jgi:hypothetical protein
MTALSKSDLDRVAIGIFEQLFRPAKEYDYQPRKNTLLHELWSSKRLTLKQQRAWHHFTQDLYRAAGKSGPVCGSYGEAVSSSGDGFKVPTARVNAEYKRIQRLTSTLTKDEQILLMDLVTDDLQNQGVIRLEDIGFAKTGYRSEDQARAAGVATVLYLLQRIASFYEC